MRPKVLLVLLALAPFTGGCFLKSMAVDSIADSLAGTGDTFSSDNDPVLVGEAVPYGRMGRAEDLTGMAVFLASAESDYIVGQTYNVDGGNWLS